MGLQKGVPGVQPAPFRQLSRDINNFILAGLVLPQPGCWDVTARYQEAKLAYVLQVEE